MTRPSGRYVIDQVEARRIREEFAFDALPERAKSLTQHRQATSAKVEPQSTEHAEFLAAVEALTKDGFSGRAMARHAGISHRYFLDLKYNKRAHRTATEDWIAVFWGLLAKHEVVLPSGTGW